MFWTVERKKLMGQRRRRRKRRKGKYGVLAVIMFLLLLAEILTAVSVFQGKLQEKIRSIVLPDIPYQEVGIKEEDINQKYYYEQLPEEEKIAYQEISQGILDRSEEIYIHSADAKRTNELFEYVLKDCPEIFWCDGTAKTTHYEGKEEYTVLEPVYSCTAKERKERQIQIDEEAEACLSGVEEGASDYDKILYVFEYIVNTVDYDASAEDNQNIYSVFVNKRSVCAGYSKATQYLLERLGVFCTYVTGTTKDGESHAWNLVICEGDYYYVDTTWGDPVFLNSEQAIDNNYISYDYMCCNEDELFKTHTPDSDVTFPECTKMDYNYYVVNHMYYDEYNSDAILQEMNHTISGKKNPSVFKFADSDCYEQAHEDIFDNLIERAAQNLAKWYGLSQVKYTYMDDPELNKIVIYWNYQ